MTQNRDSFVFFALSGAVFIYILLKSVFSPLVFDEATTFLIYVHRNEVLPWQGFWAANNHFLNTALTWLSYQLFGIQEWALRLPNLLSLPVFLFYLFKIGGLFKDRTIKWMFWATILGMHFLIEFFGLSRGYGLSFSFLIAFVWFFIKFQKYRQFNHALIALLWMILATSANLNLYFLLVFYSLYNTLVLALDKNLKAFITGIIGAYFVPFFLVLILKLKEGNQLFVGEDLGLLESINSLVNSLFAAPGIWFSVYLIILTLVLTLAFLYATLAQRKGNAGSAVFLLFLVNIFAVILSHHYLKVNYPIERTGLHIFFLLITALFLVADNISRRKLVLIVLLPILFIPLRFILDASIYSSSFEEWSQQQVPNSFYEKVTENKEHQFTVAGPSLNSDPWSYLNLKYNRANYTLQSEDVLWENAEYLLVSSMNRKTIPEYFTKVEESSSKNLGLYKSENKRTQRILKEAFVDTSYRSSKMFLTLVSIPILDSINLLEVVAKIKLEADYNPLFASFVLDIKDNNDEVLLWRETRFDYLTVFTGGSKEFNLKLGLDVIPESAAVLSVYIYNFKKLELNIEQAEVTIEAIAFDEN